MSAPPPVPATVSQDSNTQAPVAAQATVAVTKPANNNISLFEEGFLEYLDSGLYADVEVVHADTKNTYKCHRIVLSYTSLFFRKLLEDENVHQVQVNFVDVDDVFPKLLKFLYSGKAELTASNVVAMKVAANHFQVDMLTVAVEQFLDANFTSDNVFTILDKSILCNDELVTKKAVGFIAKQFEKLYPQIQERVSTLPQQVFLSIIAHEHLKEQAEKRTKQVMVLVNEFIDKFKAMDNKDLLISVLDAVLASNTLNSDSATMFLVHCDKLGLSKQASGCAQVLAANFYTLSDKKFIFELSANSFCSLLRSDDLFIKSEDSVFEIADEYVKKNDARLTLQQKQDIMQSVRFTFMTLEKLSWLKDNDAIQELVPLDVVIDALWARLSRLEKDKDEERLLSEKNPFVRMRKNRVFLYSSDFDKNGIMYWLGTNCGADKYINPHTRGVVTVTHSANCEVGKTPDLISHDPVTCNLVSAANTTVTIKLHEYGVMPTKYSLRHTMSRDSECLRNWRFQGSNDGVTFVDLSVHQNDTALNVKGGTKTWSLDPNKVNDYYQYFRILQDGNNSSNNTYFSMAGFEVYGNVIKVLIK